MHPDPDTKPIILIVEDVFQIPSRGTVVSGLIRPDCPPILKGDSLELRLPHGECLANSIADIEVFRPPIYLDSPRSFALLLGTSISSEELPRGTEIRHASTSLAE